MTYLGDRIRAEAAIADRPGQRRRLEQIAADVEHVEKWGKPSQPGPTPKPPLRIPSTPTPEEGL